MLARVMGVAGMSDGLPGWEVCRSGRGPRRLTPRRPTGGRSTERGGVRRGWLAVARAAALGQGPRLSRVGASLTGARLESGATGAGLLHPIKRVAAVEAPITRPSARRAPSRRTRPRPSSARSKRASRAAAAADNSKSQ